MTQKNGSAEQNITENERKYLVVGDDWKKHVQDDTHILQGYIGLPKTEVKVCLYSNRAELEISGFKALDPIKVPLPADTATQLLKVFRDAETGFADDARYLNGKPFRVPLALSSDDTFRVRIDKNGAKLAFKTGSEIVNDTITRKEIECSVELPIAEKIMHAYCDKIIEKHRFIVPHEDGVHKWEIDVYTDKELKGLVTAEIEVKHVTDVISMPLWIGRDISTNREYSNKALANLNPHMLPAIATPKKWQEELVKRVQKQHKKKNEKHNEPIRFR